ncbi:MAG: Glycogen synthase GlgA [Parcubacteria group bacterium GW2011_GWA2_38_13]|nr:MAG: Glycogen synthase GlgA [Parcubacteria group bacterium GW2011_GWA2_38_13]
MSKPLKIVSISSEVDPYSKSGGLADVARSLPRALKRLKHKIIVITPLYSQVTDIKKYELKKIFSDVKLAVSQDVFMEANFWQGELMKGLPIYFVENNKYFGKNKNIYGSQHENARFFFFDVAVIELIKLLNFEPDIIHCHDWHTGLIPYFLKGRYKSDPIFTRTATIYTIHNLTFQLGQNWWEIPSNLKDDGRTPLPKFEHSPAVERINFAKRAIMKVDLINAVSENYAKEILTKDFGEDLNIILKNRKEKLFGIVNGIDYNDYNPLTDPGLKQNYGPQTVSDKFKNKEYLQKYFELPLRREVPILGMATRITEQKGFDLLMKIFDDLMTLDIQFVIMGSGDKAYEKFFVDMKKKYPEKVGHHLEFDTKNASLIYAGSDIFLMPSRFEPCGLGQLISLRYGCIPVVRATGGLVDTITDFNPNTGKGNGFVFHKYDSKAFLIACTRAIETFRHESVWSKLIQNGFRESFSWRIPAKKYVLLYRKAIKNKLLSNNHTA